MSVAGFFAMDIVESMLSMLAELQLAAETGGEIFGNALMIGSAVLFACCMFYILKVYPTLFTDQPMTTSSAMVSFLNLAVGGIIFGCLWNHNLTLGRPGKSPTVFAFIYIATFTCSLFMFFAG